MADFSDEEFPDLIAMLPIPGSTTLQARRQSPRKTASSSQKGITNLTGSHMASQAKASPHNSAKTQLLPKKVISPQKQQLGILNNVPFLPRNNTSVEVSVSSKNGRSPQQRSLGLTHVDSLLVSLSKMSMDAETQSKVALNTGARGAANTKTGRSKVTVASKKPSFQTSRAMTRASNSFILREAGCADDFENSLLDEEEDEDTDLSGFIVADDAEISVNESSSESEVDEKVKRKISASPRKWRLQQGSRHRKSIEVISLDSDSDKENREDDALPVAFRDLNIDPRAKHKGKDSEVIDLTSSPVRTHGMQGPENTGTRNHDYSSIKSKTYGDSAKLFDEFDNSLRLAPPCPLTASMNIPTKAESNHFDSQEYVRHDIEDTKVEARDGFTTPPVTPPRSPSKLKSPSKLLSPSKRTAVESKPPNRPSLDGFWDLTVVNSWNDTYSPKKEPIASPRKNRFLDWVDSDADDDDTPTGSFNDSADSLPSPCSSPTKSRSPVKSPEKREKQRILEEKRAAKLKKQEFESKKAQFANNLMSDLDKSITDSKLTCLSSSTGGVQIIWSKTLRSTAGRANWRRTVTKPTGSPLKGSLSTAPDGCKVQHYASIELATKVIDCESRLVNTLAHEFCHLANFMVSNVRDQPHGASFKAWAAKVTKYLRTHDNPMYNNVEVTTKHNYIIEHKYLWVCAGREALALLRDVVDSEGGCGAEYGRHSKSIDTDKHRCGRCKGALVQIRPKPRKTDPKRSSPRKALFQKEPKSTVEAVTEAVDIVDLSD